MAASDRRVAPDHRTSYRSDLSVFGEANCLRPVCSYRRSLPVRGRDSLFVFYRLDTTIVANDQIQECRSDMRYSWEIPYVLAILETDERTMHSALYDAIAALEQRPLSPVSGRRNCVSRRRGWIANADRGSNHEVRLNVSFDTL